MKVTRLLKSPATAPSWVFRGTSVSLIGWRFYFLSVSHQVINLQPPKKLLDVNGWVSVSSLKNCLELHLISSSSLSTSRAYHRCDSERLNTVTVPKTGRKKSCFPPHVCGALCFVSALICFRCRATDVVQE